MLKLNERVDEIDLGDQVFLELEQKTVSINNVGRIIYSQIKLGKAVGDIVKHLISIYGQGNQYEDDVNAFVNQLIELGFIEDIDRGVYDE